MAVHDYVRPWGSGIRRMAFKPTKIRDGVELAGSGGVQVSSDVPHPWVDLSSVAPTVSTIHPCTVFIGFNACTNRVGTPKRSPCFGEPDGMLVTIDHEVVTCDTKLPASIVVITMTGDHSGKQNLRQVGRSRERDSAVGIGNSHATPQDKHEAMQRHH